MVQKGTIRHDKGVLTMTDPVALFRKLDFKQTLMENYPNYIP
jgi:hypothetical protein